MRAADSLEAKWHLLLQDLHPFLVAELDAVHRVVEDAVFLRCKLCDIGREAAGPTVGGLALCLSDSLAYLRQKLARPVVVNCDVIRLNE